MKKYLFFALILLISLGANAQRKANKLHLEGTVLGYDYDPAGFFKKEKVQIQGSVGGVEITAKEKGGNSVASVKSKEGGEFDMYIPLGKQYTISYTKKGYGLSAFEIDLTNIPKDMQKSGVVLYNMELIVNDNETDRAEDNGKPCAKISYNNSSRAFVSKGIEYPKNERLFKKMENNTPVNLIASALAKNTDLNQEPSVEGNNYIPTEENTENIEETDHQETTGTSNKLSRNLPTQFKSVSDWKNLSKEDLDKRAEELSSAWEQLEKDKSMAVTEEDFMLIQAREEMLKAAEKELEAANALIDEQDMKLSAQRKFTYSLIGIILLLGGLAFLLFRSIKQKKIANFELEKRNKKITASITYAERIQRSILLSDDQIKAIIPESFVFYKPLDVVSGDFYWFSEVNGKAIMAAIDCTGHGVPGAFMSLIGNTLMNQIVNEKKITDPAAILKELHHGIVSALRQEHDEEAAQDGMDMSICSLNKTTRELKFAGAMNPVFLVNKGEVSELSADIRGIGGILRRKKPRPVEFNETKITLDKGTCIYMFSDGYMDQFGGNTGEKFNLSRFKELLKDMEGKSMQDQKQLAESTFNKWKGNHHQIDDILLIGAKV